MALRVPAGDGGGGVMTREGSAGEEHRARSDGGDEQVGEYISVLTAWADVSTSLYR